MQTFHAKVDECDLRASIPCRRLWPALDRCEAILRAIPQVTVEEVQVQRHCSRVALYVVLRESSEKILNLTITGPNRFQVEFRFSGYLPDDIWDRLIPQTLKVRYASSGSWAEEELLGTVHTYVQAVRPDVLAGIVAQGSDPERRICRLLEDLMPGTELHREHCPPAVREAVGARVRFDFFLPALGTNGVAVEVDGPGHVRPVRGEAAFVRGQAYDRAKDQACRRLGIGMVRVRADAKDQPAYSATTAELRELLRRALTSAALGLKVEV